MASISTQVLILGAGPAGQVMATMMKTHAPKVHFEIVDAAPEPRPMSNEYGCNYLWEPVEELGPCEAFNVYTTIDGGKPDTIPMVSYKEKVGKVMDAYTVEQQSQLLFSQFKPKQMGYRILSWPTLNIRWGKAAYAWSVNEDRICFADETHCRFERLISCIPLTYLTNLIGVQPEMLSSAPVHIAVFKAPPSDTMYVNYLSNSELHWYRTTLWRGTIQYESLQPFEHFHLDDALEVRALHPGKLYDPHKMAPGIRKGMNELGVYTIGRYASWKPDVLLHDAADYAREVAFEMKGYFGG